MATKKENPETQEESKDLQAKPSLDMASFEANLKAIEDLNLSATEGFEEMDSSDLKIQSYNITQPLSKSVSDGLATPGVFFTNDKINLGPSINVVLLSLTKQRVRWAEKFQRGQKPLCRSFDRIKGVGNPGGSCASCPLKEWGDNNEKPECGMGFSAIMMNLDTNTPFRISFFGASVSAIKTFYSRYKLSKFSQYPIFAFQIKIGTEKHETADGTWFQAVMPNFQTGEGILGVNPADTVQTFHNLLEGLRADLKRDFESDSFFTDENASENAAASAQDIQEGTADADETF